MVTICNILSHKTLSRTDIVRRTPLCILCLDPDFFSGGGGVPMNICNCQWEGGGIKTYFWSFYIVNLRNLKFSGGPLPLIRACIYFNYFNTGLIENDYCSSVSKLLSFIHNILTKTAMKTSIRICKLSTKVLFFFSQNIFLKH